MAAVRVFSCHSRYEREPASASRQSAGRPRRSPARPGGAARRHCSKYARSFISLAASAHVTPTSLAASSESLSTRSRLSRIPGASSKTSEPPDVEAEPGDAETETVAIVPGSGDPERTRPGFSSKRPGPESATILSIGSALGPDEWEAGPRWTTLHEASTLAEERAAAVSRCSPMSAGRS